MTFPRCLVARALPVLVALIGCSSGEPRTGPGPATFAIQVNKAGSGSGTVESSPEGITCGQTCGASFIDGSVVVLAAEGDAGSLFVGWAGAGCVGTDSCSVTVGAARFVTATFLPAATVTISVAGGGQGSVGSGPPGLNCGTTCSAKFLLGSSVHIFATAAAGSTFTGWTGGDGCGASESCIFIIVGDMALTANFQATVVSKD